MSLLTPGGSRPETPQTPGTPGTPTNGPGPQGFSDRARWHVRSFLPVLAWLVALAVWKYGRIEEKWSALPERTTLRSPWTETGTSPATVIRRISRGWASKSATA